MVTASDTRRRNEAGATLVQYVLLIAGLALVVLVAARHVGSSSKQGFEAAGSGVGAPQDLHDESGGGEGSPLPGGGGGSGAPGSPTSTPVGTVPPPTTSTTVAAPTTTSTTTTTTTTPPDQAASAAFDSSYGVQDSSSRWHAHGELTMRAPDGSPVPGATVEIVVRGWSSSGGSGSQRFEQVVTLVADADGRVVLDTGLLARSGSSRVNSVTMSLRSVEPPDGYEWDGATPQTVIARR